MVLTEKQIDTLYTHVMQQLRLRIDSDFNSLEAFGKKIGVPRTSLSKMFSDNIQRDLSIGMYLRMLHGLGIIESVTPAAANSKVTLKEYLAIDNNMIMGSISIISNDL